MQAGYATAKSDFSVPTFLDGNGRQHYGSRQREAVVDRARSKNPCMYGCTWRGSREMSWSPVVEGRRSHGEVHGHTPMMNGRDKSDSFVVPEKRANKAAPAAAERVEERELAKGNSREQNASRTQRRANARSALARIRKVGHRDRKKRATLVRLCYVDSDGRLRVNTRGRSPVR